MQHEPSEFYVGYVAEAPPALARFMRRIVAGLLAGAAVIGVILVAFQSPFAAAVFEYGVEREFAGILRAQPVPHLVVPRPDSGGYSRHLLSGEGKHGFSAPREFWDHSLRLRGSLIQRDGLIMLQSSRDALTKGEPAGPAEPLSAGPVRTLTGEIVDSKCYLGVMNPGSGKVHRDCAVRCLSGGIPPAFAVRGQSGRVEVFVLTGPRGARLHRTFLQRVAEPVTLTGAISRLGDLPVFQLQE